MSAVDGTTNSEPLPTAKRRRWWQRALSLRALMLVVLIIGSSLGLLANRITTRARALAMLREGRIRIDFQDTRKLSADGLWRRLSNWTGAEFCREVDLISVLDLEQRRTRLGRPAEQITRAIARISETKTLVLGDGSLAASDLEALASTALTNLRIVLLRGLINDRPGSTVLLPQLKTLSLGTDPEKVLPSAVISLAGQMPALEQLYLDSPLEPIQGDDLAPLARLTHLTLLDLNRTIIDESALTVLDQLLKLEAIWVRGAAVSDETLARIVTRHPDLLSIEVDGSNLTDAGVASLARLPKLTMVILRGTPDRPGHLTDASLVALGQLPSLRRLVVTCGHFGATGLDALRGRKWVRLALRSVAVNTTSAIIRLVQGQTFEWLRLGGPGVTDDLLPHLGPSLIPKRTILDLTDSAITDAGLVHLAPLPIEELVLNRTGITDVGLDQLAGPFSPRGLYLRDTKATPAGLAAFDTAHPRVRQPDGVLDDD